MRPASAVTSSRDTPATNAGQGVGQIFDAPPAAEVVARLKAEYEACTGGVWPLAQWHEAFETMHSGRIVKAVLKPEDV